MAQEDEGQEWKSYLKKGIRYLLQAIIIGYLGYKLYDIGLSKVVKSLPLNPLFYLLFFVIYFSLPVSEIFIYGVKWNFKGSRAFLVFVQKKVLNTDVLGYSGEFYLFYWAKEKLGIAAVDAMKFVKDNNIISSLSSTLVSVILLIFFISEGYINIANYIPHFENNLMYLWIVLGIAVVGFIAYKFRTYILSLGFKESLTISGIYTGRLIFINFVQVFQYYVAEPTVPWAVWFTLMAVEIMSTRIPFLPSRDVLFASLALEMAAVLNIPEAQITGVITANLILKKLVGASSFLLSSLTQTKLSVDPKEVDAAGFEEE